MPSQDESVLPFMLLGFNFITSASLMSQSMYLGFSGQDTSLFEHDPVASVSVAFCHSLISLVGAVENGSGMP
jgi:hypothetical protein